MKTWGWLIVLGAAVAAGAFAARWIGAGFAADKPKDDAAGIAVVELFTSEGCSSCPPADDLLGELVKGAREDGRKVFALSFHVDYWNRLGWTDPYSDAAYSRRQNDYAAAFQSDRVYTPQMIVNGGEEFVGSDRERARKSIDAALKVPSAASVKVRLTDAGKKDDAALTASYEVAKAPKGAVLNVALVERGLVSKVGRGENGGGTLRHENVVRFFRTVRLDESGKGEVELKPPADLVRKNASVIAYVQKADGGAVVGAAAVDIGAGETK
jgi:hypothetical protein